MGSPDALARAVALLDALALSTSYDAKLNREEFPAQL